MKRRGFLGFMAGAAAAGPSMAKQAVAGMESLSIGGSSSGLVGNGIGYANAVYQTGISENGEYDPIKWARNELAEFLGRSAADLLEQRLNTGVDRLDPDLAVMRSISLATKIRLQRDRNFDRHIAGQKSYLTREIDRVIKRTLS